MQAGIAPARATDCATQSVLRQDLSLPRMAFCPGLPVSWKVRAVPLWGKTSTLARWQTDEGQTRPPDAGVLPGWWA